MEHSSLAVSLNYLRGLELSVLEEKDMHMALLVEAYLYNFLHFYKV